MRRLNYHMTLTIVGIMLMLSTIFWGQDSVVHAKTYKGGRVYTFTGRIAKIKYEHPHNGIEYQEVLVLNKKITLIYPDYGGYKTKKLSFNYSEAVNPNKVMKVVGKYAGKNVKVKIRGWVGMPGSLYYAVPNVLFIRSIKAVTKEKSVTKQTKTYEIRANDTSKFEVKKAKLKIKASSIRTIVKSRKYDGDYKETKKKSLSLKVNKKTKYRICDDDEDIGSYTAKGRKSTYGEVKYLVDDIFRSNPYSDMPEGYYHLFIKVKKGVVKSVTLRFLL